MGFEAHLMVNDPDPMLATWVQAGCEIVIVHAEATRHLHRTLSAIADLGARAGVALNPATPLEAVVNVLDLVDLLLVMTVNPGFGGQRYIASMETKIAAARREIDCRGGGIELEVDGGIGVATIDGAARAGADVFCAGSSIFQGAGTMSDRVGALRSAAVLGGESR
jgi:ribulose-phosphate 3-epimerase